MTKVGQRSIVAFRLPINLRFSAFMGIILPIKCLKLVFIGNSSKSKRSNRNYASYSIPCFSRKPSFSIFATIKVPKTIIVILGT